MNFHQSQDGDMLQMTRPWPVNLNPGDENLFGHERLKSVQWPGWAGICLLVYDPYHLYGWPTHYMQKKHGLILGTFNWKDISRWRVTLSFNEVLLADHWSANYFHWFTECYPKIWWLIQYGGISKIKLPVWLYDIPFIRASLETFPQLQVITVKRAVIKISIFPRWCKLNMITGNYNPQLLQQVFQHFRCKANDTGTLKRYCIYRSAVKGRGIINFNEVEQILQQFQIEAVDFEKISWNEQVAMMQSTSFLMGVHGAGLTNMLFMPKGSIIWEWRLQSDTHNNCYFSLAAAMEHKYYYQLCKGDATHLQTQQNNFWVDTNVLKNELSQIFEI
jgi:hypothetical protein